MKLPCITGHLKCLLLLLMLCLSVLTINPVLAASGDEQFMNALQQLTAKKFNQKSQAISEIENSRHSQVKPVLNALLTGNLYYRKSDKVVFIVQKQDETFQLIDVLSDQQVAEVGKRTLKKISINNTLRSQLRSIIARVDLSDPNADVRRSAVQDMMKDMSLDAVNLLQEQLVIERSEIVKETIQVAIALYDIKSDDKATKLNAINALGDSVHPEANNLLKYVVSKDADGNYVENDLELRLAAQNAISTVETKLKIYSFAETLFFGVSLGSVLLLSAIGLAITFGVMGVINMAHGELMMLGAYTTYVVQLLMPNSIEYSLMVAVPAAFLVAGFVGILIERGVLQFLYGRPLETLLATFGISLILQQVVRSVFSPLNRSVETPEWMSGAWEINSALALTYNRLYIIIFSLIIFALLILILKKTALGLYIRSVSQNREMAKAMGVRSEWVDALTFGLGSGIAGIAGVALSQLTNVGPNLGQAYIIDSFMVVVFGGVGNLWGTFVAAMSLGVVNKFLEPWSGAVLAKIIVLVFIILFIQKRPKGLFPQKGRAGGN